MAEQVTGAAEPGGALHSGGAFGVDQVEEPAAFIGNQQPAYPGSLARLGVSGRVRARFVVGENGRVHGTPEVVLATSPEFEASVRVFLARARYRPARIGGKPVPQMVEQDFVFELRR